MSLSSAERNTRNTPRVLARGFSLLLLTLGGFTLLAIPLWNQLGVLTTFLVPPVEVVATLGFAEVIAGCLLRNRWPQLGLALFVAALAVSLGYPLLLWITFQPTLASTPGVERMAQRLDIQLGPVRSTGDFFPDPLTGGSRGAPDSVATHLVYPDFFVRYDFDEASFRAIPKPEDPIGEVDFLGCSFTFGSGVENYETYPSILARRYWKRFHVRNLAVAAWGTTENHRVLKNVVLPHRRPAVVFYGWSTIHLERNWLRESWWSQVRSWGRNQRPLYDVENGILQYHGLVSTERTLPDDAEMHRKEMEISLALLWDMDRLCRQNGVRFFVIHLNHNQQQVLDEVVPILQSAGIAVIDAHKASNSFYVHDPHGTPEWHEAVASAVASDPRVQFLSE